MRRAVGLVWGTSRGLTIGLALTSLLQGVLPGAVAWVGKLLVDAIVAASTLTDPAAIEAARAVALRWVVVEFGLVVLMAGLARAGAVMQSLLRAQLGHRVNVMILEKALTLDLRHFEDSELYDKMTRARREASSRPLALVMRTFGLAQNGLTLVTYAALLATFSWLAVLVLVLAAIPAFIVETRFSNEAFRLFRWRTPEARQQMYLESVLAREDHAKEVKLYDLGPRLLKRYQAIFDAVFGEDRKLTMKRGLWGFALGVVGAAAFYGAYAWIAIAAIAGAITLGQMTMYVLVFKQGQSTLAAALGAVGGMYEDNLYLSTLYEFLDEPVAQTTGSLTRGPDPSDGIRFRGVAFTYPGAATPALHGIDLHLPPGRKLAIVGSNGSGKTTLIKLLTRLYEPTEGSITLDGLDLRQWDPGALRERIGVIFQDFVQYQLTVGENIGAGDERDFDDRARWSNAADKGLAAPFIDTLPKGYDTQLGRWFKDGRELSLGQWQKIALSRAFMRERADVLVLDEPTASIDAEAEVQIFDRFRALTERQIAVLISHRFSTVRMADDIVVMDAGTIVERGSHESLMTQNGRYARLFTLQAQGYR
jgi:ATP-binding cassette subfamily B protein